ncbi:VENOM COMPONENT: three-fingered toxin-19 [Crotalus adamanteus]|uniref:VENOM COMPONENT: three-fingered toxin-17 n=1 Tax=Crotalus adamanteus TaxID=8729 RepID=A0AAW1BM12_CROAD
MKALLFALLLVAFVCKDAVKSLKCYESDPFMFDRKKTCSQTDRFCYILQSVLGGPQSKGCAPLCVLADELLKIQCCTSDFCNV